ncbi:MAG: hypothetical protein Q9209_002738 [Squamulea sp. 1 TL-2023]
MLSKEQQDTVLWPQQGTRISQDPSQASKHDNESSPLISSTTPQRLAPNSGKKRKAPDLSRYAPGSSHCDKMSAIFEDASRELTTTPTSRPAQANARRLRTPFSMTSSSRKLVTRLSPSEDPMFDGVLLGKENLPPLEGGVQNSPTPPQLKSGVPTGVQICGNSFHQSNHVTGVGHCSMKEYMSREPISSGIDTLTKNRPLNESTNQGQVVYPDLTHLQPSTRHTQFETAIEQTASGGNQDSPIIGNQRWLTQIPDDGRPEGEALQNECQASRIESESPPRSPSKAPLASRRDHLQTPSITGYEKSHRGLTRFPHPLTSSRYLSAPPTRKALRSSPTKDGLPAGPDHQQFDIFEEESSDELVELSPTVEKYRKGRRPKRDRCVSYWDDDVLPEFRSKTQSPKPIKSGRQPLHEMPELTKAKGFVDGVEHTEFNFNIKLGRSRGVT